MTASAAEDPPYLSFEEFLATEQSRDRRHEYVAGRVYLMSGGSERHGFACSLVHEALGRQARAYGCRHFQEGRLLRLGSVGYYPDVLVVWAGAARTPTRRT